MSKSTATCPKTQPQTGRSVRFLPDLSAQGPAIAITVKGVTTNYWIDTLAHDYGQAAYQLEKAGVDGDNEVYQVLLDNEFSTCTCADFTFRQRACKHIMACQTLHARGTI